MKTTRKLLSVLLAFAVMAGSLSAFGVTAQAAPKTTTTVYDAKVGMQYRTAVRQEVQTRYPLNYNVFLVNAGDYVDSVKSSSPNLVAKVTEKKVYTGNNYSPGGDQGPAAGVKFKNVTRIQFFARREGKYTVKMTIKNAAKKKVATKKITVYATPYCQPLAYLSYAGQKYLYADDIMTKKDSGKLSYKVNPTFQVKSISVGTYNADGTITYKKVKNNAKITLAKQTAYTEDGYSFSYGGYSSSETIEHNYIKPVTFVKITYYDKYLKITSDKEYTIINVK